MRQRLLALAAVASLGAGALLHLVSLPRAGDVLWAGSTAAILVPLSWSVARSLLRRDVGVDAIALVSMAGALALGQYLAGAVIALMLAGGNALEELAAGRARRELTELVARAPRTAWRREDGSFVQIPIADVSVGDVVLVRAGEVVPTDGVVMAERALLDESALTGEPLPVSYPVGGSVRSGTTNAGEAFELRAIRPAAESAYATLVRLVQEAERQSAPFVRLADRYAAFFLPVTLIVAGLAWGLSGEVLRALAVFVVATPCPLILAAPIAIIAGVSRAARAGVIVKGGSAIEKLGGARTVLLDKTGTLTLGTPRIERLVELDGLPAEEMLRLAASLDQLSVHSLAAALVKEAHGRGLHLSFPESAEEGVGEGVEGVVDGRRVAVGSADWLEKRGYEGAQAMAGRPDLDGRAGRAAVFVGVDGSLAGAIVLADRLRADARDLVEALRSAGIREVAMVTGDRIAVAEEIGESLGVDHVYAEQTPQAKLEIVRSMQALPELRPVIMVGDGVNDAPALALADVGIAMGSTAATASSEAADAIIVVDRIDRVVQALRIGRRSLSIARQSVLAGIGLSFVAMGFAAFGLITPVLGALLQEVIDVAVILNALRALRD